MLLMDRIVCVGLNKFRRHFCVEICDQSFQSNRQGLGGIVIDMFEYFMLGCLTFIPSTYFISADLTYFMC